MSDVWLHVVGIGEDGWVGLNDAQRAAVASADVLVGGARHLAMLPEDSRLRLQWPSPFDAMIETLERHRSDTVCVLATGDPLCFGVGKALSAHFSAREMSVLPSCSAFALARARLGWPADEVTTLSVHGRPISLIEPSIQPAAKLLVLSNDGRTPALIANRLVKRGYEQSEIVVLEHLGASHERIRSAMAERYSFDDVRALNTVAIRCVRGPTGECLSTSPGLPDDCFEHDGQLTKRLVRAGTLSSLRPTPGALLWDVGAGCGSVGIEWMRAARGARCIAIEDNAERQAMISRNADALGVPHLTVVPGRAPSALEDLEPPDAVFIGGGVSDRSVFDACWHAVRAAGRLVANAISLEGATVLHAAHIELGGELHQISVARAEPTGQFTGFRPARPVTQLVLTKEFAR